jgi:hypothetical protein
MYHFDVSRKVCSVCEEAKNLSEFYRHPKTADGYLNKCKACHKHAVITNRNANLDRYRAYDRGRGNRQTLEDQHRYREENPKKRAAHVIVGNAIRDGKLLSMPCEVCGVEDVHGHHSDYNKPLEVMWLCPEHHKAWHKLNGEGLNAH